jgi:hypothetical protein
MTTTALDQVTTIDVVDPVLIEHASVIRALGKRVVRDIIEIGRRLAESKERLQHGDWLRWLEREFGWSRQTADNFLNVYSMTTQAKVPNFSNLPIDASALYLLARKTADDIRDDVIERAENGERITYQEVTRLIEEAKSTQAAAAEEAARAQAAEHERQLKMLTEKYEREAAKMRADIGELLSPEAMQAAIDEALGPLQKKIKRLEEERDKRKEEAPKRPDPYGLPATAIIAALHQLSLSLTITPKQVLQRQELVADATGQKLTALLAEPVRDAKTAVRWLERFIEETKP